MGNEAASIIGVGPAEGVPTPFTRGDFEVWLSRQSQPQPYRSAAEDADAHARFLRLTEGITQVVDQRVQAALAEPAPEWLIALVRVLHARKATVLTFNYDPLIECAVEAASLYDWDLPPETPTSPPGRRVGYRNVLADGEARRSRSWLGLEAVEDLATFSLLKLHGSTTWYGVPGDSTGATLRGLRLPGVYGSPDPVTERERRRELPGHYPFIVPPTAAKSGFYADPLLRQIWEQGAIALRDCDRAALLGYSLPLTDLVTRGLFQDNLRSGFAVDVADIDPRTAGPEDGQRVVERLLELGYQAGNVYDGGRCIADMVEALVDERAPYVRARIDEQTVPGSDSTGKPMAVGSRPDRLAIVFRARPGVGGDVVVETLGDWTGYPLTGIEPTPALPVLEKLRAWALSGRGQLLAQLPGGSSVPIIDVQGFVTPLGAGRWTVLVPATDS